MEQLTVRNTALLCICLSLLLLTPAAFSVQVHGGNPSLPTLTRRLKVILEATKTRENIESKMKATGALRTGELQHKEAPGKRKKEEKKEEREWEEEIDPSELLTMDYHRVRRRRPIHNKSLPVGP